MKKLLAMLLAALCLLGGAAIAEEYDLSEPYELVIYVAYDGAKDLDMVTAEINKITQESSTPR